MTYLAGGQSDAVNITPANWTYVGKKVEVRLIKRGSKLRLDVLQPDFKAISSSIWYNLFKVQGMLLILLHALDLHKDISVSMETCGTTTQKMMTPIACSGLTIMNIFGMMMMDLNFDFLTYVHQVLHRKNMHSEHLITHRKNTINIVTTTILTHFEYSRHFSNTRTIQTNNINDTLC